MVCLPKWHAKYLIPLLYIVAHCLNTRYWVCPTWQSVPSASWLLFLVVLPGSCSLPRAGPICTAHHHPAQEKGVKSGTSLRVAALAAEAGWSSPAWLSAAVSAAGHDCVEGSWPPLPGRPSLQSLASSPGATLSPSSVQTSPDFPWPTTLPCPHPSEQRLLPAGGCGSSWGAELCVLAALWAGAGQVAQATRATHFCLWQASGRYFCLPLLQHPILWCHVGEARARGTGCTGTWELVCSKQASLSSLLPLGH